MCCCGDDFEDAWFQERRVLGFILVLLTSLVLVCTIFAVWSIIETKKLEDSMLPMSILSPARVIPQLFSSNSTRISASAMRVQEDSEFRSAFCIENPKSNLGKISAILQIDVSPGGLKPGSLEMSFEVPLIETSLQQSIVLRRCPAPACSHLNYIDGIGSNNAFYNMDTAFFTQSAVTWNRKETLPYPIVCGCSEEYPVRFSCTMNVSNNVTSPGGSLGILFIFQYPLTRKEGDAYYSSI